jgi:stage II sporulation protein D
MMANVKRAVQLLLLAVLASFGAAASAQTLVRVLLADVPATLVAFDGPHRGSLDGRAFATSHGLAWPVTAVDDRLWIDGRDVGESLDLSSDDGVVWNGRPYRGTLRLSARAGSVRVVNVLDLESYLRGVVPAEMQASWPAEALKAQAVAARTYTLHHLDASRDHDV